SGPHETLTRHLFGGHVLGLQQPADDIADQFRAEETDTPKANYAGDAEHHAQQGRLAPTRLPKQGHVGTETRARESAVFARLHPSLGLFEPHLEEDTQ